MNNLQKRFLLFLFGCIGTRSLLVYIAKTTNKTLLMFLGYLALLPAIGFFYLYFSGSSFKPCAKVVFTPISKPLKKIIFFINFLLFDILYYFLNQLYMCPLIFH